MYNSVFISIFLVAVFKCYGTEQVQMPDVLAKQSENELESQIKDLQKNISDLWSYIYELRTAVGHHLTHLRQHQVALERFHKGTLHEEQSGTTHFTNHSNSHSRSDDHHHSDDHHGDDHSGSGSHGSNDHHGSDDHHGGDSHGSNDHHGSDDHHGDEHHGDDHHGSDDHSDDHHHGDDHGSDHSQSHDSHSHDHGHGANDHSHGDDNSHHSHGGDDHHSHSGEHHSHSHSDEHSHSHDNSHSQSHDHSQEHTSSHSQGHGESHQHEHKDSRENEDLQQKQDPEPAMEPVVLPTKKPKHYHHHQHGNHPSRTEETQQPAKDPLRLFPTIMDHHHHHEVTSGHRSNVTHIPKYSEYSMYQFATCNVNPNRAIPESQQQEVKGQVSFWQKKTGGPVGIHVRLQGFSVGDHHSGHHSDHQDDMQQHMSEAPAHDAGHKHGFHVHAFRDMSNGCESLGPHYNPKLVNHGGPRALERHVGDLGNIECDDTGVTNIVFSDDVISLSGQYSIVGRSTVIHSETDDYGLKPNDLETLKTGNAGIRIACCVIEHIEKLPIRSHKALKTATQHQN